ncbi:MAG: 3-hydroxyisobutyrate dehydrogenase [Rhodospirillales bacterium CG15_BIG_FIL_POST_REV_8_21_14_020_66_15]|nr:MAG: 3-hydroxyisobutyrate dehydrogenase [Rhodospirillales bacterium CG15_BIG_FIL_POST_REV_8_21_14_020_66_15]
MTAYRAAVIGLGAMGMGMAKSLVAAGVDTAGCDISEDARAAFAAAGGRAAATPSEAAAGADAVAVVVVNARQVETVLTGPGGVLDALSPGAVVLGCATMPPDTTKDLADKVEARGGLYLDAPISGGPVKAAAGGLSVMASGSAAAFAKARPLLDAVAEKVFDLGDAPGPGSTMKMVNQLLAGVHIASAMEALALAIKCGLDPNTVFEVISASAGNSWMFENRVPHVLDGDYSPKSAVDIFIKDLGIVLDQGQRLDFPLPISQTAFDRFKEARDMGLGRQDDASVIKVYKRDGGITLPGEEET